MLALRSQPSPWSTATLVAVAGLAASAAGQCPRLLEPFPPVLDLTQLDGYTGFRLYGRLDEYATSAVGESVSAGGDLNGDGLADVLVGAPRGGSSDGYCSFGPPSGAAYIMFGSAALPGDALPDRPLEDSADGVTKTEHRDERYWHGQSVAYIGDVNGDGFDDVAIGAPSLGYGDPSLPRYGYFPDHEGRTYVIFGTAEGLPPRFDVLDLDGTNGFRLEGGAAAEDAGWAISPAGDLNGDGLADVAIGAPQRSSFWIPAGEGAVYIVYGRDSAAGESFPASVNLGALDPSSGFVVRGAFQGDQLGDTMAMVGDINGDGRDDLAFGTPSAYADAGSVYILYGRETTTQGEFPQEIITSEIRGDIGFRLETTQGGLGDALAAAGDVNADGIADLIVGAPDTNLLGIERAGRVYVVFGREEGAAGPFPDVFALSDLDGENGFSIDGVAEQGRLGRAVAGIDISGDGVSDLVFSQDHDQPFGGDGGGLFVLYGADVRLTGSFPPSLNLADLDGSAGFSMIGQGRGGRASGSALAPAGDLNGDGLQDLLIGAPFETLVEGWGCPGISGIVYVLFGRSPRCCADLDYDGQLTIFDFLAFQYLFNDQHPFADFDSDGEFTIFDFLAFQTVFEDGCP